MGICINGIGIVGGFGSGIDELMACINSGSIPRKVNYGAGCSEDYYPSYRADTSRLADFVPRRELRRIDHFSQLALTGAYLTIKDSGLDSLDSHATGLVICTGYGSAKTTFSFLDSIIEYGDTCASPTLFSNSVHNAAAGYISILLGLEGPCLTISQFEMSVASGLLSAIRWLEEDRTEQVLFGAVDEYCDVLGYCYQHYFGKEKNMKIAPLVTDKQSAIPGEGAAFFMLSKSKPLTNRYGTISSVTTGSIADKNLSFAEDTFYILNADGHNECDKLYSELVPQGSLISCYTPLYGSMPTGTAFDMAIGALSFKEGKLFSSPESVGEFIDHKVVREICINDKKIISCIKAGRQGELSLITISK